MKLCPKRGSGASIVCGDHLIDPVINVHEVPVVPAYQVHNGFIEDITIYPKAPLFVVCSYLKDIDELWSQAGIAHSRMVVIDHTDRERVQ